MEGSLLQQFVWFGQDKSGLTQKRYRCKKLYLNNSINNLYCHQIQFEELALIPSNLEELKSLLSTIQNIQLLSLEYETRIIDVQERFRVLLLSNYVFENDEINESNMLRQTFDSLTFESKNVNYRLTPVKTKFTEITKEEINDFGKKLSIFSEKFKEEGPASVGIDLDLGLIMLKVIYQDPYHSSLNII